MEGDKRWRSYLGNCYERNKNKQRSKEEIVKAKGQQWVTEGLEWHQQLQSALVCHVDGLWCCKGPGRKGLFFFTVPRGDFVGDAQDGIWFPSACLLRLLPDSSAHRKTSRFPPPLMFKNVIFPSIIHIYFALSSLVMIFTPPPIFRSFLGHISGDLCSSAGVHLSASGTSGSLSTQHPILHGSCQVSSW